MIIWAKTQNEVKKFQPVLSLKPTQFAVGLLEVEYKVSEMKKMRTKKLNYLVNDTPIPVVVSPWKEVCVIDKHKLSKKIEELIPRSKFVPKAQEKGHLALVPIIIEKA